MTPPRKRITLAILALGGQGGGVLADWIIALGEAGGWIVQGTSVPGVAQRTGSTVYYLELYPEGRPPILGLMPAPGDVDVVIASELMEAGRAMVRGFVTPDRTTLIASTNRIYAISEKSAMGDGMQDGGVILAAATSRASRFIGLDMDEAATRTGSVISSVMFGALAGSGALPFSRAAFEGAIRAGGKAVAANLAGFAAGFDAAQAPAGFAAPTLAPAMPAPTTAAGARIAERIARDFPPAAHALIAEGVRRLMDYQDLAYAELYLARLTPMVGLDTIDGRLVAEAARHLALWMSYEDVIRVADLKTRASRFDRVKGEVALADGQVLGVTEFMHPRYEELCELAPTNFGMWLAQSASARRILAPLFTKGRFVRTTSLRWFLALSALAALRPLRRLSLRFALEQQRIEAWLRDVASAAEVDQNLALEIMACQDLLKGYGETHARGLSHFERISERWRSAAAPSDIRRWRDAALADEDGVELGKALAQSSALSVG